MEVHLQTLPPAYTSWNEWERERKLREDLASLAFQYKFDAALDMIVEYKDVFPNLVNSTRPDSSKFWTLGHQVVHYKGSSSDEMMEILIRCNFWNGARDVDGQTVMDLKRSQLESAQKTSIKSSKSKGGKQSRDKPKSKSNWKCRKCKRINNGEDNFCTKCGTAQHWKCPKCQHVVANISSIKFCPKCGEQKEGGSEGGCLIM